MRLIPMTLLALCVLALCGETVLAQDAGAPQPLITSDLVTPPPAEVTAPPAADPTAPTVAPDSATKSAGGLLSDVFSGFKGGNWRLVVAGILSLLMIALGKVREMPWSPFKGDRGGAILVLLLAEITAVIGALGLDAPVTFSLILGALLTGATAAGGYAIVRRIIWPKAGV